MFFHSNFPGPIKYAAVYNSPPFTIHSRLQFAVVYNSPSFTIRHRLQFAVVYS